MLTPPESTPELTPDSAPVHTTAAPAGKHHPLMIAAAIAIIVLCLAGTAAILGWLPSSMGGSASKSDLSEFDKAALSAKLERDGNRGAPALALSAPAERNFADTRSPLRDQHFDSGRDTNADMQRDGDYVPSSSNHAKAHHVAQAAPEKAWCASCGNVESVRAIKQRAQGSGLGAAGGAVLGGLLGNQIGGGHGRQLATVAGAVGGAVVGNQVEGNMKATTSYEITVRLDDGSARTFHQNSTPRWGTGDRVKVVNGSLHSA